MGHDPRYASTIASAPESYDNVRRSLARDRQTAGFGERVVPVEAPGNGREASTPSQDRCAILTAPLSRATVFALPVDILLRLQAFHITFQSVLISIRRSSQGHLQLLHRIIKISLRTVDTSQPQM